MPIAFVTSNGASGTAVSSLSCSLTITGEQTQLVIGTGHAGTPQTVDTPTWNASSTGVTQRDTTRTGPGSVFRSAIYTLTGASGTANVQSTLGGAADEFGISAAAFSGVDPNAPVRVATGATGATSAPQVNLEGVKAGDWVVDFVNAWGTAIVAGSEQTSRDERENIGAETSVGMSTREARYNGGVLMSWTETGGSGNEWTMHALALVPYVGQPTTGNDDGGAGEAVYSQRLFSFDLLDWFGFEPPSQDAVKWFDAWFDPAGTGARTAATSLDAAVQIARTVTASLDAGVQIQGRTATTSLDAALQLARTAAASLDAAVQAARTSTTSLDAGVQTSRTATSNLDAAVQLARSASANLDAAIRAARSATASLDAAVQAPASVTASLDAALQAARTALASLDAAVQTTASVTTSLDAQIDASGTGSAVTSLDAAVQAAQSATASLDAAVQVARSATASVDAAVQIGRSASASLDSAVQAPASVVTALDAAVQATQSAAAAIDAAIQATASASTSLDAFVQAQTFVQTQLDAAVQAAAFITTSLSAVIDDGTTPTTPSGGGGPDKLDDLEEHLAKRRSAGQRLYRPDAAPEPPNQARIDDQPPGPAVVPAPVRLPSGGPPGGLAALSDVLPKHAIEQVTAPGPGEHAAAFVPDVEGEELLLRALMDESGVTTEEEALLKALLDD